MHPVTGLSEAVLHEVSPRGSVRLAMVRTVDANGTLELVGFEAAQVLSNVKVGAEAAGSFAVCMDLTDQGNLCVVLAIIGIDDLIGALRDATAFNAARGKDVKPLIFQVGRSQLALHPDGRIRIKGDDVQIEAHGRMKLEGAVIDLN